MSEAVKCDLFLYADDTCLVCQHEDINKIENQLNEDFCNICDWFVDNKLSIHFGEDKTKSVLFASKFKRKNIKKSHIKYGDIKIKQDSKVKYLGCLLDEINNKLKFLYHENSFLTPELDGLLLNALIQRHFDYACSAWYPNLTKKLKYRIQTTQNKCVRFCLQLDKLKDISHEEFDRLNWLPVTYRFKQCVNAILLKYFNEQCPNHLNEVFDVTIENNFQLRGSFQKLKCQFRKTNTDRYWLALSCVGPTFWNKTPDTFKHTKNLNTFKHNLKYFLNELRNCNNSF